MEDRFDYIDYVQHKRLQQNLREWEEKDAPKDVVDRVKAVAKAMVDPDLVKNMTGDTLHENYSEDVVWNAANTINAGLEREGWTLNREDSVGSVLYYEKSGYRIKVEINEL